MTERGDHLVRGVDHTAFVTFDPAATVRFYRDVLGFPLTQAVCAKGWGAAPDFVHFFFDAGQGHQIAFFYYFDVEPYRDEAIPELLDGARHLALRVDSADDLDEYVRRLTEGGHPPYMRVAHESIESIYVRDPNGLNFEITRALRPIADLDRSDAELSIEALLDVVAEDGPPTLERVWRRKASLIEPDHGGSAP